MAWLPKVTVPGLNVGDDGCLFGAKVTQAMTASARVTLPAGLYVVKTDADDEIEFNEDGGTTYDIILAASSTGVIWSDGQNVSILNTGTAGTVYYWPIG